MQKWSLAPHLLCHLSLILCCQRPGQDWKPGESPTHEEGCIFLPGAVEVVRGAPDGNGFLYPSHPPIGYTFVPGMVPASSAIADCTLLLGSFSFVDG